MLFALAVGVHELEGDRASEGALRCVCFAVEFKYQQWFPRIANCACVASNPTLIWCRLLPLPGIRIPDFGNQDGYKLKSSFRNSKMWTNCFGVEVLGLQK